MHFYFHKQNLVENSANLWAKKGQSVQTNKQKNCQFLLLSSILSEYILCSTFKTKGALPLRKISPFGNSGGSQIVKTEQFMSIFLKVILGLCNLLEFSEENSNRENLTRYKAICLKCISMHRHSRIHTNVRKH